MSTDPIDLWTDASRQRDIAWLDLSRAKERVRELEIALRKIWDDEDVTERIHGILLQALECPWSAP